MATIPELSTRAAVAADIEAVVALVESAYRGDASRVGWTTEADLLDGRRTDAAAVEAIIASPTSLVLVGEREGALVACCHLAREGPARAYFGMFAVSPARQGAGVGRAMIVEATRRAAAEWGSRELRMTVIRQRVDLLAWYERLGFGLTGETEPFPYGDERFGRPRRDDLEFVVLSQAIG